MLNLKIVTTSLAAFGGATFLVCAAYGLVVPQNLHMHMAGFLEGILPGFHWISPGSFFLGLAESILYGVYAGVVFVPLYNAVHRQWASDMAT